MSIKDCIDSQIPGKVPGIKEAVLKSAKKIEKLADRIEAVHADDARIPEGSKRAFAEEEAMKQFVEDIEFKQMQAVMDNEVLKARIHDLETGRQTVKRKNMHSELKDIMLKTYEDGQGLESLVNRKLNPVIDKFRSKIPGGMDLFTKTHQNMMDDLIRGISGSKKVSRMMREYADAINASRAFLVEAGRSVGMKINQLENYGISTSIDRQDLLKHGRAEYIKDTLPLLDPDRIRDHNTGVKIPASELPDLLGDVWDEASKGGIGPARGALAGTMNADAGLHRVLHFKGVEGELSYVRLFKKKMTIGDIMRPLEYMARDIAIQRKFGSNFKRNFKVLKDKAEAFQGEDTSFTNTTDGSWKELIGEGEATANEVIRTAGLITRLLYSARSLGMAGVNSVADLVSVAQQARLLNMSFMRIVGKELQWMFQGSHSAATRAAAAEHLNLHAMSYTQGGGAQRWMGSVSGAGNTATGLVDATVRLSGAPAYTRSTKTAFGGAVEKRFADAGDLPYDKLDQSMKNTLEFYKQSPEQWERWRLAADHDGYAPFLNTNKMELDDAIEWASFRVEIARAAVPEPGLYAKTMATGGKADGTVSALFRKGSTQHMTFLISSTHVQLQHVLFHPSLNGKMGKAKWAAHMAIYSSMIGAIQLSMYAIATGKDIPDFTNPISWVKAATQGNMLGSGFVNRQIIDMLEDPRPATRVAALESVVPTSIGIFLRAGVDLSRAGFAAAEGKGQEAIAGVVRTALKNAPIDSIAKLPFARLMSDQINKMADPKFTQRARRSQRRQEKITGQKQYWKTGDLFPSRAPSTTKGNK